ncbi:hypothetical protein ABKV83_22945 (plasmid) [Enterobacter asburiae]|uniref:hypothetical protein n=1 Tax=Enterobacter asburiae TaxID=61645 RepID=UPI0032B01D8A
MELNIFFRGQRVAKKIYFLLLLLFTSNVSALSLPDNAVYRVDDREPSVIFNTGFQAYGTNDSVDQHVSGDSIRSRTSAWIATTDNVDTASQIARTRYNLIPSLRGRTTWIYEIAQTDNMYDLNSSLQNELRRWFLSSDSRNHLRALLHIYASQREIGALRTIQPQQIVRARQVVWDRINGREQFVGEWIDNTNYNENTYQHTRMNQAVYDFSNVRRAILGVASTIAFYATSWCIGSSKRGKSEEFVCDDGEEIEYTDKEVLKNRIERTNYIPHDL